MRPARIDVEDGTIVRLRAWPAREGEVADAEVRDFGERVIFPGLVDTHVHVNEPGHADWEGFATAGRAALAGGVTTIVDMPLNSVPVTASPEALEEKRAAAESACPCDYGFWGGLIPDAADRLEEMAAAGALGFKAFLIDSGLLEFPPVDRALLERTMPRIAELGLPLLVHAELPGPIAEAGEGLADRLVRDSELASRHATWAVSRPPVAESEAIDVLAGLSRDTGCRVHIVHVSGAEALAAVERAKRGGAPLTAETCPHHLALTGLDVPDGATEYKCAPPLREPADRDALWRGLVSGTLDLVATDHSPCLPEMKPAGDFFRAWGGIASLGLALSVVWTEASARGLDPAMPARWLATEPARLAGLEGRKGSIAPGMDADFAVFDPRGETRVTADSLRFRHPTSPYVGRTLKGRVSDTFLRGRHVFGTDPEGTRSKGRWLTRA